MDSVSFFLDNEKSKSNYYKILNCSNSSTTEQILAEYRVKALQLHPDKNPDNPGCIEQFRLIQKAKDVLCDPEKRKSYDKWLYSGISVEFERWLALNANHSMHWAPKNVNAKLMVEQGYSDEEKSTTTSKESQTQFRSDSTDENLLRLASWRPEDSNSSLLKKFRNYQI